MITRPCRWLVLSGFLLVLSGKAACPQDPVTAPALVNGTALRDIKGPVDFPGGWMLWLVVGMLILAGIGFFILRRSRRKGSTVSPELVDTRTPWEIAFNESNQLKEQRLLEQGLFKEYYSILSDIVRRYFERRFDIKAPDMTTEEFLWSLENSQALTDGQKATLKKFLSSCDIVKFAKYIPLADEATESFRLAQNLVDETKPVVADPAQA